jgi:peptide chain release factor 2
VSPSYGGIFDVDGKRSRLTELAERTEDPALWSDPVAAKKVMQEKSRLEREVEQWASLRARLDDALVAVDLAVEEDEAELAEEARDAAPSIAKALDRLELRTLLGEEEDVASAILEINAGAGGTDAQDWAEMLLRMYARWGEAQGYKVKVLDRQYGEEAGIKSATLSIDGEYAFGYLRSEMGVHRLVRISPFDANARRQTAFSAVTAFPDIDREVEVEILDKDLRVDRFRASGAGGQHVNTTDSAVRITHLPTGIVVQCQNERSQHKNLASAMKVLKVRLYDHLNAQAQAALEAKAAPKQKIEWGSQIRSYVLAPYRMVKDLRTQHETGNVDGVLDGDLSPFMEAWLSQQADEAVTARE